MWKFALPLLLLPSLLGVVWSSAVPKDSGLESVRIPDVPHIRQKPDFCGEACVAMAMNRWKSVV